MEMDALKRAQEMHRGARPTQSAGQRRPVTQEATKTEEKKPQTDQNISTPLSTAFDTSKLFEDKEKLLILLLILILSSEGSNDPTLILALLYVII